MRSGWRLCFCLLIAAAFLRSLSYPQEFANTADHSASERAYELAPDSDVCIGQSTVNADTVREARDQAHRMWWQGKTQESAKILTEEWNKGIESGGASFIEVARDLSGVYLAQGSFTQSARCYDQLIGYERKVFGDDNYQVASDLNNQGIVFYLAATSTDKPELAKQYFADSLDKFNRSVKTLSMDKNGASNLALRSVWSNQAYVLRDMI
jgi:hypothetical protein